ncbi:MAG: hypothetical protein A4E62_00030 [Syntrophorhabdus sp. PtaU1.Bin002]|nr:MAG: hypothetical protein A4E62_00030 [Syntrophorhabdus sp. PtaU1.Bin002]
MDKKDLEIQAAKAKAKPDITNLRKCIDDAKKAAMDGDTGPKDPTDYSQLRGRLEACREKLPPLYREAVFKPYAATLDELGQSGFTKILLRDPERESDAGLMLDIAHSILQNGEGYKETTTDSFQEVISDLYDGFLSAEDRQGVKPPDKGTIPPLVKWGRPDFGPYTWPVDATSVFGLQAGVVNLPPANAKRGLLAWAALGHETTGHDILYADTGLLQELATKVRKALEEKNVGQGLPEYWADRIDETASDILGILNIGPSAGIGLIGYFRALNEAYTGEGRLRNDGPEDDPHPADIIRGYLAASAVGLLKFSGANGWAKVIQAETEKDLTRIRLGGAVVSPEDARQSAGIVASTLMRSKMECLDNHALGDIQDWRDHDETITKKLRAILTSANQLPKTYAKGLYAAHVVAAAVTAALSKDGDVDLLFSRMVTILKTMHDGNASWGPLYVAHPGDIMAIRAYSFAPPSLGAE